jgi:hypothetical protein
MQREVIAWTVTEEDRCLWAARSAANKLPVMRFPIEELP